MYQKARSDGRSQPEEGCLEAHGEEDEKEADGTSRPASNITALLQGLLLLPPLQGHSQGCCRCEEPLSGVHSCWRCMQCQFQSILWTGFFAKDKNKGQGANMSKKIKQPCMKTLTAAEVKSLLSLDFIDASKVVASSFRIWIISLN